MHSVGVPPSVEAVADLRNARAAASPEEAARRRLVRALADECALRAEAAAERLRGKDCGWM